MIQHHRSSISPRSFFVGLFGASVLSGCILRTPITNAAGFRPKQLKHGRTAPADWGWSHARLDTIARTDSAGGILAWWGSAASNVPTCGGALLLHGKGRNRAEMMPIGRALQDAGFAVLIPDYRGFGGSDGVPSTNGLYSDAALAYRTLRDRLGDSAAPIVIVGHSMGTALAARLSREHTPAMTVYMSPYTRVSAILRARLGGLGPRLFDTTAFAFNPLDDAAQSRGRAMVITAGRDGLIPGSVSDAFIAGLAPATPVIRDGKATHNGLLASELSATTIADSARVWTGCSLRR